MLRRGHDSREADCRNQSARGQVKRPLLTEIRVETNEQYENNAHPV